MSDKPATDRADESRDGNPQAGKDRSAITGFTRLTIDGMHCAACVTRLEKILGRQAGVQSASVNLATESALIEHTADWQVQSSIAAIRKAGFEAHQTGQTDTAAKQLEQTAADPQADSGPTSDQASRPSVLAPGLFDPKSFAPIALSLLSAIILMLPMLTGLPEWPAWMQFLLCTPVQFGSGAVFLRGAVGALRTGLPNMDMLVALGSLTAWSWSTVMWLAGMPGHLFFEASASVIAFVLLGKWLEKRTRDQTAATISGLSKLRPDTVERVVSGTGGAQPTDRITALMQAQVQTVPLSQVRTGDVLRINPASRIPCDGLVLAGTSHIDESSLTGESIPAPRSATDTVHAGSLNLDGILFMQVTQTGEKTLLGQVIHLIERAQGQKLPAQALADRIAAVFVPIVLLIAAVTFSVLLLNGYGLETALLRAVTVLVIACPCALGLATPAAIIAGTGAAARAGLLIRDPRALHVARCIDTVVFDKTGTLTLGQPVLKDILLPPDAQTSSASALQIAAALQTGKAHPLGHALREAVLGRKWSGMTADGGAFNATPPMGIAPDDSTLKAVALRDITLLPGIGMEGWQRLDASAGQELRWLLCHPRHASSLLKDSGLSQFGRLLDTQTAQTGTISVLLRSARPNDWAVQAVFTFEDAQRPDAAAALAQLKDSGLKLILLSGDRQAAVDGLAGHLPLDQAIGECSPADKATRIKHLQAQGRHIAMVGDGVNDAPAMALADLAIAMGSGTDIAAQTAHITLMNSQLSGVAASLDIARRIHRNIAENLFWAFAYNTVCIPLAALGWFNPMMAAAAMALSSVSVVANALRLTKWTGTIG